MLGTWESSVVVPNAANVNFEEMPQEQETMAVGTQYTLEKQSHDEDISKFFSRPVHLYDLDWTPSISSITLQPWYEWFTNKRISNRIANYHGFRGNLHLKFAVIGNPYYFGRMQISYRPLEGYGGSWVNDDQASTDPKGLNCIRSQRMMINIDPSVSTGAEMILPYVWPHDFTPIARMTVDSLLMGMLHLTDPSQLRSLANTTGSIAPKVTLRVYAWVDNIELIGNTAFTGPVVPQCDSSLLAEQSGANNGLVSSALTTISGVASNLASVSGFAPYALPAQVAASAGAKIAQALGFSKPLNLTEPLRYQPRPFDSKTHVVGADTCVKLTLDPNQITTVDPEVFGAEGDEMSFKSIISKPSLYNSFHWDVSNPPGTLLFQVPVTPKVTLIGEEDGYHHTTAVGGIANLFEYWSGSMEYRFDVISTAFHRGRILVIYDPLGSKPTDEAEEVVQYAAVVDISEARSFSVKVGFNSQYGQLPTGSLSDSFTGSAQSGTSPLAANGNLSFYVANDLSIPSIDVGTPTDVHILCYVNGCDDLNFCLPRTIINQNGSNITFPVSFTALPKKKGFNDGIHVATFPNADTQLLQAGDTQNVTQTVLDVSVKNMEGVGTTYAGERIDSLRTLCKRNVFYYAKEPSDDGIIGDNDADIIRFRHGAYPAMPGRAASTSTVTGNAVEQLGFTTIAYAKNAFVAIRGGMRWTFVPLTTSGAGIGGTLFATRLRMTTSPLTLQDTIDTSGNGFSKTLARVYCHTQSGCTITSTSINDTLEFEMPYQNIVKFFVGRSEDNSTTAISQSNESFEITGYRHAFPTRGALLVSAAEDFTLQHFVGWPPYTIDEL